MFSSMLTVEFLLGFLECYPAAVTVFDLDGKMVFVNEHGCNLAQKSKSELIGRYVQDFVADEALAESLVARVMSKGYVESEVNVAQSGGKVVGVRLTGMLVKDSGGKPMGFVGMARGTHTALGKPGETESAVQRTLDQFPEPRMLTVREVADELRVNQETVRRWVRRGQLPCIKLPRGIRIPSEVIKALILTNLQMGFGRGVDIAQKSPEPSPRTSETEASMLPGPAMLKDIGIDVKQV